MINSLKGSKKKNFFGIKYIFKYRLSSLVRIGSGCEGELQCQQAFSALAKDAASHPYPKGSNTTMLVHSGVLL